MRSLALPLALPLVLLLAAAAPARATDVDGPDCNRDITDYGDAPEGFPILYATSPIGHYPTCLAPSPPGTQELGTCPAISSPPGVTGFMRNVQTGLANYWIGCYTDNFGAMLGIDTDLDGKTNGGGGGASFCNSSVTVDCGIGFPTAIGQDECVGANDAGLASVDLAACFPSRVTISTANCGSERQAYLNVLVDWNQDGDWNDVVLCDPPTQPCTYEWSVKNAAVLIPGFCGSVTSPPFLVGPNIGYSWMRISLTDSPVDDDFPWAGSANQANGWYLGGETEDYRVLIVRGDPVSAPTWGGLKIQYR